MYVTKCGWSGHEFALATASNESGGRKSRIRRSKEERKTMVEYFIKKYQKSNNGNFPSLNLTHKEVGGSFYTVREIVREIIQENRVLAPPKVSLEEPDHYGYFEQHPLSSISMQPHADLSGSDRVHPMTDIMTDTYEITSDNGISDSRVRGHGSYPLGLDSEQTNEVVTEVAERNEFENEEIVSGVEMPEESSQSDNLIVTNVDSRENVGSGLLYCEQFNGPGTQRLRKEQGLDETDQIVYKTREFRQRVFPASVFVETEDTGKHRTKDVEASRPAKSHVNSDIVVEKFPLRPVPHNVDGWSGERSESAEEKEDKAIPHDRTTFCQSSSYLVDKKEEKTLLDSTVESDGEFKDDEVVLNLEDTSLKCAKVSTASEVSELHGGDAIEAVSKASLPDGTEAHNYSKHLFSVNPTSGRHFNDQHNSSLPGRNNLRINTETQEEASKKPSRPENSPLLAALKAIAALIKFWAD